MSKYWRKLSGGCRRCSEEFHEAGLLKLNCDKALAQLNWMPTLTFEETVRFTVDWYKNYYENKYENLFEYTVLQIEEYTNLAKNRDLKWAKKKE